MNEMKSLSFPERICFVFSILCSSAAKLSCWISFIKSCCVPLISCATTAPSNLLLSVLQFFYESLNVTQNVAQSFPTWVSYKSTKGPSLQILLAKQHFVLISLFSSRSSILLPLSFASTLLLLHKKVFAVFDGPISVDNSWTVAILQRHISAGFSSFPMWYHREVVVISNISVTLTAT